MRSALTLSFALAIAPCQAQGTALPYDLAFDTKGFSSSAQLAVAPSARHVAYAVRHAPAVSLGERYLPNGTPSSIVGSTVHITELATKRTVTVDPGGNSWRPAWSPDSTALTFYCDADGPPQLWRYDLATARATKLSDAIVKPKLWEGDEPRWSPDGTTIYVTLAPEGEYRSPARKKATPAPGAANVTVLRSGTEVEEVASAPPHTEPRVALFLRENLATLAAIDVLSGEVRVVVPAEASPRPAVLRLSASGKWLSYLSVFKSHGTTNQISTFDIAVAPTAGGAVHTVATDVPKLSDYFTMNYAWHPREDLLAFVDGKRLFVVEFGPDGPEEPRRLGAELGDLVPTLNWFTRDGAAIVVGTDSHDDKGDSDVRTRGIAVVQLDGGVPTQFSFDDERWSYLGVVKADERTVWQPDGDSVTLLLKERATGETNIVRFEPSSGDSTVLWHGLGRFDRLTAGKHHDFLLGTYEDLSTPPNVYRFSADFAERERISHVDPRLDGVASVRAEVFSVTAPKFDGTLTTVRAAVMLPKNAKRGDKLPGIVMIYPGSDVTSAAGRFGGGATLSLPTLLFTSRGFAVVLVNLTLGPDGQAGNPMQEMVDILLPQVYRAAELGYVDIDRLAIGGQSFGGYGTASIISRTNLFRAAVAVSGSYDLFGTYGHIGDDGSSFWIGWSEGGQARMGNHPWADMRRYLENSPYYHADKIHTPLLLVHGTADSAYHDAQKMFAALRRLDRPAQLASYADQGHVISTWRRRSAEDAAERIVGFLRQHLDHGR